MKDLAHTDIQMIPLDQLYLHAFNPRQVATEEQIEAKAASMATSIGLMENLLGYDDPESDGTGIVAGGLRLRGLQKLSAEDWARYADQKQIDPVPVRVTSDPITARAWALGENISIEPLSPVQEMRAYRAMADETGATAELIARSFGKSARHVERRLALANLPGAAITALDAGQISIEVARALTLARTDDQLQTALTGAVENGHNAHQVRHLLTTQSVCADDPRARFVGIIAYTEAGGTMTQDLFTENHVLHDGDILDKLFHDKLTNAAERIKADEGWNTVTPVFDSHWIDLRQTDKLEQLQPTPIDLPAADDLEWEDLEKISYDKLTDENRARMKELRDRARGDFTDEDRANGTVFVCVSQRGELNISRAWAKKQKTTSADDGVTKSGGTEKPAIPASVTDDLHNIRLAALQGAMHNKPDLALDLLAYQLDTNRPSWSGPLSLTMNYPVIEPSIEDGVTINSKLTAIERSTGFDKDCTWQGFEEFCAKGKKHRNTVLALHLSRAVNSFTSNDFVTALEADLTPDFRKAWTPTAENFFKRVRTDYLEQIWADMLDLDEDDERRAQFAKLNKGARAKELDGLFSDASVQEAHGLSRAQIARIDAWLPEGLK